jgi:hypothetical protein
MIRRTIGVPRVLWLLACGLALAALYHAAFAQPYSLEQFGARPRQSIGTLTNFSNDAAYRYIGGMAALFVVYAVGLRLIVRQSAALPAGRQVWGVVIVAGAVGFCLALLPMYPVDASDIYDYILRGRMSAVYDLNPLRDLPTRIPDDPFFQFTSWRRVPSAYGPVWELIAHGISALTSDLSRNPQVIAYKLAAVAGYALTALFIVLTLRQIAPRRTLIGAYLFLWNPLVVYMTAGTGHNDAVMTACVAFALYCVSRRWFVLATLGALLGVMVKFIPALLLPFIALAAWRTLGGRRRRRFTLLSAVLGGALLIALYAPYWHGWDTIRAERRAFMLTGSVAAVARQWLMPILDGQTDLTTPARSTPNATALVANGTLALFGLIYAVELARLWRTPDPAAVIGAAGRAIFAYLLIASIWFHAWYVIWLIGIVALLDDTPTRRLALWFSYLVTWQALLYNHFAWETRSGAWLPWLDLIPVALYMGVTYALIIRFHWKAMERAWLARTHNAA